MRRKQSLSPDYFAELYRADPDPWKFDTSDYERAKYEHTLNVLPKPRFAAALEVGCANGALTARLAERCDRLIAVDVVDSALEAARRRCADQPWVEIRKAQIPRDAVDGRFDLVLLSEVAYYWDSDDLAGAARYLREAIAEGGCLLMVHWTGETDYPKSADEAIAELGELTGAAFNVVLRERMAEYRLDLWRRSADQAER